MRLCACAPMRGALVAMVDDGGVPLETAAGTCAMALAQDMGAFGAYRGQ